MKMGKITIVDSVMVLLNISNAYTILPCILFTSHVGLNSLIIAILTLVYIIIRFGKNLRFTPNVFLLIFISLYSVNMVVALAEESFALGFLGTFISNWCFYYLLLNMYNCYIKSNSYDRTFYLLIRGYLWLCLYQLVVVALMVILVDQLNLFNPLTNDISNKYDIFSDNVNRLYSGLRYYFPYNICLFVTEEGLERLPFLHNYGIITGIFHEPHTMTYYIVPLLFLLPSIVKSAYKRIIFYLLFIVYILVAASTTNLLCTSIVLLFALCINNKRIIVLLIPAIIIVGLYIQYAENPILDLIEYKFESGSKDYSESTLLFAFTPQSLFGTNFLNLSTVAYGESKGDVGLIIFFLNLLFLFFMIKYTLVLSFSKIREYSSVGLFSMYFILHSTKLALRTYTLGILIFVSFVLFLSYHHYKINSKC